MGDTSPVPQGRITSKAGKSHSGGEKPRFIRPVERQRMRPWLIEHLDQNDIPGLVWQNRREKVFRIAWKHAANQCFNMQKDTNLFERWAIHTGRHYDSDHKRWKANFRCALNSLPDVVENKEQGIKKGNNAFKVYRFMDEKETKSVKEVKAGRRKKDMLDKMYHDPSTKEKAGTSGDTSGEDDENVDQGPDHNYAEFKEVVYVNIPGAASGSGTPGLPKLDQLYGVDLLLEADSKDRYKPLKPDHDSNLQEILAAATASLAAGSDAVSLEKISIEQLSRLGEVSRIKLDVQSSKSDNKSGFMYVFLCGWCEKVFPSKVELFQHFLIFHQDRLLAGDEYGASAGPDPSDPKYQKLQKEIEDLEKEVLNFTRQSSSTQQCPDSSEVIEDGEIVDMSMDSKMTSQEMYVEDQALDLSVKPQRRLSTKQEVALDLSIRGPKKQKAVKSIPLKPGIKRRRGSLDIDYSVKFGNYGISGKPRTKRQLDLHSRKKEEEEEKEKLQKISADEEEADHQHSVEDLVHAEILMLLKTGAPEETDIKPEVGSPAGKAAKKENGKGKKLKGMPKRHLQHLEKVIEEVAKKGNDGVDEEKDTAEKNPKKAEKVYSVKAFKCGLCLKKFENSESLLSHVQVHKSPYTCEKCEQDFGTKSALMTHMITHTSIHEQHRYQCNVCMLLFRNKSDLKNHHAAHPRIFICQICEEKFESSQLLAVHEKVVHTEHGSPSISTTENDEYGGEDADNTAAVKTLVITGEGDVLKVKKAHIEEDDIDQVNKGETTMEKYGTEVDTEGGHDNTDEMVCKTDTEGLKKSDKHDGNGEEYKDEMETELETVTEINGNNEEADWNEETRGEKQVSKMVGETFREEISACNESNNRNILTAKDIDETSERVNETGDKHNKIMTKTCHVILDRIRSNKEGQFIVDNKGDAKIMVDKTKQLIVKEVTTDADSKEEITETKEIGGFENGILVVSAAEIPDSLACAETSVADIKNEADMNIVKTETAQSDPVRTYAATYVGQAEHEPSQEQMSIKIAEDVTSKLPAFSEISSDVEDIVLKEVKNEGRAGFKESSTVSCHEIKAEVKVKTKEGKSAVAFLLKRNMQAVHCGICEKRLQFEEIQTHLQAHDVERGKSAKGVETLSCIICNVVIPKKDLNDHLTSHSVQEMEAVKLLMNQYGAVPEKLCPEESDTSMKKMGMKEDVKLFLCNLCNQGYDSCARLAEHVEKHLTPMHSGKEETAANEDMGSKRGRKRKMFSTQEKKDEKKIKQDTTEDKKAATVSLLENEEDNSAKQVPFVVIDSDVKRNSILAAALNSAPKYASNLPRTIIVTKAKETPISLLGMKISETQSLQQQAGKNSTLTTITKGTLQTSAFSTVVTISNDKAVLSEKVLDTVVSEGTKHNMEPSRNKSDARERNLLPGQTVPVMLIRQDNQDVKFVPASSLVTLHPELKSALSTGQLVKIVMPSGEMSSGTKVAPSSNCSTVSVMSNNPTSNSPPVPISLVSNLYNNYPVMSHVKSMVPATVAPASSAAEQPISGSALVNQPSVFLQKGETKQKSAVNRTFVPLSSDFKNTTAQSVTQGKQSGQMGQLRYVSNDPNMAQISQQLLLLKNTDPKMVLTPGMTFQIAKQSSDVFHAHNKVGQTGQAPIVQSSIPSIVPINLQSSFSPITSIYSAVSQHLSSTVTTVTNTAQQLPDVAKQPPAVAKQPSTMTQQASSAHEAVSNTSLQQTLASATISSTITDQMSQMMLSRLMQPQLLLSQASDVTSATIQSQLLSSPSNIGSAATCLMPPNLSAQVSLASASTQKPTFNLVFAPSLSTTSISQLTSTSPASSTASLSAAQISIAGNLLSSNFPSRVACLRLVCNSCNQELSSLELMGKHICSKVATTSPTPATSTPISPPTAGSKMIMGNKITLYPCGNCKATFTDFAAFLEHIEVHNHEKPLLPNVPDPKFTCHLCPKMFATEKSLIQHVNDKHTLMTYRCTYCSRVFMKSSLKYNLHLVLNHSIECKICKYRCKSDAEMLTHFERHSKTKNVLQCEKCWVCFSTIKAFLTHIRLSHPEESMSMLESHSTYRCNFCVTSFSRQNLLIHHLHDVHFDLKVYHCGICAPKVRVPLKTRGTLGLHLASHTDTVDPKFCHECLLIFPEQLSFGVHINDRDHGKIKLIYTPDCYKPKAAGTTKSKPKYATQDNIPCGDVDESSASTTVCNFNIVKDDSEEKVKDVRISSRKRMAFPVILKGKVRKTIVYKKEDMQRSASEEFENRAAEAAISTPELYCSECGQGPFKSGYQLKQHRVMRHICPRNRTTTYYQHLMNKRSFDCMTCGKRFDLQSSWLAHQRSHKLHQTFACDMPDCEMKFKTKGGLQAHRLKCSAGVGDMEVEEQVDGHILTATEDATDNDDGFDATLSRPFQETMTGNSPALQLEIEDEKTDFPSQDATGHTLNLSSLNPFTSGNSSSSAFVATTIPFLCKLCDQDCGNISDLKLHLFTCHSDQFLECCKCRRVYLTSSDFDNHKKECSKNDGEQQESSDCKLKTVKKVQRKKLYGCSLCQKTFFKLMKLTKHVWEHDQLEQKNTKGSKFVKSSSAASKSSMSLDESEADTDTVVNVPKGDKEGKYMCSVCKIVFKESADIFQHSKSHLDPLELVTMARNKLKHAHSVTGDPTKIPSAKLEIVSKPKVTVAGNPDDTKTRHACVCNDCKKLVLYEENKLCEMIINHVCVLDQ